MPIVQSRLASLGNHSIEKLLKEVRHIGRPQASGFSNEHPALNRDGFLSGRRSIATRRFKTCGESMSRLLGYSGSAQTINTTGLPI